jgi:uncharacterized protein (DUF433 family)
MSTDQTEKVVIQKTPDVCGGRACVGNRRIPVWQLLECRNQGLTDEQIMEIFETPLTPAELEAAWAYLAENRQEVEEDLRENLEDATEGSEDD